SLPSYKYRSKVCLDTLIWSANIFVLPVAWYMPSKYISYTLVLFFVTVFTLQLDQLIYKKLRFIQIFNWRSFFLESSNILQCTDSVKATSFFHAELFFCKPNHINTPTVVM